MSDISVDLFADAITAKVQEFLKGKTKSKKTKESVLKWGAADNTAATRIKKLTLTTRERIDRYASWTETSKVLWIGTQTCKCCGTETAFVGGIFVDLKDPKSTTRVYVRRTPVDLNLPVRVEYDKYQEDVPFCVECIETVTRPIEDQTEQSIVAQQNQLHLF